MKFRMPELLLGALLTISVFGIGMLFDASLPYRQVAQHQPTENRADKTNNGKQNEGLWDWMTHDAAGFFTLWLVIVGGSQLGLFYWQLRLIKRGADDTADAANAAQRSAEIAHVTMVATARPKIIVRRINVARETNRQIAILYSFVNVGNTPAHIYESNVTILATPGPRPPLPEYDPLATTTTETTLNPGQLTTGSARSFRDRVSEVTLEQVARNQATLFLIGYVKYRDDIGSLREMAFIRRYATGTGRFNFVEDPDYEYSD